MSVDTMYAARHLSAIEKLAVRVGADEGEDGCFDATTAMERGQLAGWNVRKWPALATDPVTGAQYEKPGRVDIVRDSPNGGVDWLGETSKNYGIVQNEEHVDLLNSLAEESGARFTLAGSIDGGRRVFLAMRMPGHINIGGVDPVECDILSLNSHNGSLAYTLMATPVRYACANVLNVPYGKRDGLFRVRHTSGASDRLREQVRAAIDYTFDYLDEFQAHAERLAGRSMTDRQFEEIVRREFGVDKEEATKNARTLAENKIESLLHLFSAADSNALIRGTAWAGFNALTEWADHFSPTRGEHREESRAEKALLDPGFKARAYSLMAG